MRKLSLKRKIFLVVCIILPFVGYSAYYYAGIIKNAPYRFAEFDHISFEYGPGPDSLVNKYNTKTGQYQYVDNRDSLVKIHMKLASKDLLYLHRKASELGFWDFPVNERGDTTKTSQGHHGLRYVIEFSYKRKTKRVVYDKNFDGDPKLKDANEQLIQTIQKVLDDAENDFKQ